MTKREELAQLCIDVTTAFDRWYALKERRDALLKEVMEEERKGE